MLGGTPRVPDEEGNQRSSEVIRGHQSVIRASCWAAPLAYLVREAIRGHQR